MSNPVIRPYRSTDRADLYDVCLRTADSGQDATAIYADPELVDEGEPAMAEA